MFTGETHFPPSVLSVWQAKTELTTPSIAADNKKEARNSSSCGSSYTRHRAPVLPMKGVVTEYTYRTSINYAQNEATTAPSSCTILGVPVAGSLIHLQTGEQSLPVVEDLVKLGQVWFLGVQQRSSLNLETERKKRETENNTTTGTYFEPWYVLYRDFSTNIYKSQVIRACCCA